MNCNIKSVDNGYVVHMSWGIRSTALIYKTEEIEKMITDVINFVNTMDFPNMETGIEGDE